MQHSWEGFLSQSVSKSHICFLFSLFSQLCCQQVPLCSGRRTTNPPGPAERHRSDPKMGQDPSELPRRGHRSAAAYPYAYHGAHSSAGQGRAVGSGSASLAPGIVKCHYLLKGKSKYCSLTSNVLCSFRSESVSLKLDSKFCACYLVRHAETCALVFRGQLLLLLLRWCLGFGVLRNALEPGT